MATLAGKAAAEIGHAHRRPSFKQPWWFWACIECTPDLYRAVTRPEVGFDASVVVCPFCHEKAGFGKGVMFFHSRYGEPCPCSGMSRVTAEAMLEAAVSGRTVEEALRWARFTKAEGVGAPVKAPLHPLISEIKAAIKVSGVSVRDLSARLGIPENSLSKWWNPDKLLSPRLDTVIAAAHEVGMQLVLDHRLGSFVVRNQEELHTVSRWLRAELEIDTPEMGRRLGISDSVACRREKNESRLGLIEAANWVRALGGRLGFKERGSDG